MSYSKIQKILGDQAQHLLNHKCQTISRDQLHIPGPDWVDRIFTQSDRHIRVMQNMQEIINHGRIGGTGYVSILPVDQGIEHTAGASFAPNPAYFDPENIGNGIWGHAKSGSGLRASRRRGTTCERK